MTWCKKGVTPLLRHGSYVSFALSHWHLLSNTHVCKWHRSTPNPTYTKYISYAYNKIYKPSKKHMHITNDYALDTRTLIQYNKYINLSEKFTNKNMAPIHISFNWLMPSITNSTRWLGRNWVECYSFCLNCQKCHAFTPVWCQAITWSNVELFSTDYSGEHFSELLIEMETFSFKTFENVVCKRAAI